MFGFGHRNLHRRKGNAILGLAAAEMCFEGLVAFPAAHNPNRLATEINRLRQEAKGEL
jgi:hypothetical protein